MAVDAVLGAGIAGADVSVLSGEREDDAREAPSGGFAGERAPGEAVGSFAGHNRLMRLLTAAGLDEDTAARDAVRDVHALNEGRVLVLVASARVTPSASARCWTPSGSGRRRQRSLDEALGVGGRGRQNGRAAFELAHHRRPCRGPDPQHVRRLARRGG
jgi:hypothetical protein